jgi:hypothetical protein
VSGCRAGKWRTPGRQFRHLIFEFLGRQEISAFLPDLVMGADGWRLRSYSLRHDEEFLRPGGLKRRTDRGFYQPLMNGPIDNVASA